ncbi:unnamed protein product, partial [Sphacelaria rigidula]
GQRYKQVGSFVYLGGKSCITGDVTTEVHSRICQAWTCLYKCSRAGYDSPYITMAIKVHLLETEVIEAMLHGCVTWTT